MNWPQFIYTHTDDGHELVSSLGLLWIMLVWTFFMCLCCINMAYLFSVFWRMDLGVGLRECVFSGQTAHNFLKWLHHFMSYILYIVELSSIPSCGALIIFSEFRRPFIHKVWSWEEKLPKLEQLASSPGPGRGYYGLQAALVRNWIRWGPRRRMFGMQKGRVLRPCCPSLPRLSTHRRPAGLLPVGLRVLQTWAHPLLLTHPLEPFISTPPQSTSGSLIMNN